VALEQERPQLAWVSSSRSHMLAVSTTSPHYSPTFEAHKEDRAAREHYGCDWHSRDPTAPASADIASSGLQAGSLRSGGSCLRHPPISVCLDRRSDLPPAIVARMASTHRFDPGGVRQQQRLGLGESRRRPDWAVGRRTHISVIATPIRRNSRSMKVCGEGGPAEFRSSIPDVGLHREAGARAQVEDLAASESTGMAFAASYNRYIFVLASGPPVPTPLRRMGTQ